MDRRNWVQTLFRIRIVGSRASPFLARTGGDRVARRTDADGSG
jgi:hypothetical protein